MTLREKVELADLTSLRVGGTAAWFGEPEDVDQLRDHLEYARKHGMPVRVLGRGTNLLIPEGELPGLTLCLRRLISPPQRIGQDRLQCSAGMSLPALARHVAELGFSGYEFYTGIPGTVGGAVVMNAGFGPADARQTANRCLEVELLDMADGKQETRAYAELQPQYRATPLQHHHNLLVLGAVFKLENPADRESIRRESASLLRMRKDKQPLVARTAGSVFRAGADGTPAAVWIDRAGLKGYTLGGARVSPKHANWIENHHQANSQDIDRLIRHIRQVVLEKFDIQLEPEIVCW